MKTIAVANRKVEESKITCPKGIFTKEEFLKMVKTADRETKNRQQEGKPDRPV
jgi:hypothetical protein